MLLMPFGLGVWAGWAAGLRPLRRPDLEPAWKALKGGFRRGSGRQIRSAGL